jgi:primary-amine oxidase
MPTKLSWLVIALALASCAHMQRPLPAPAHPFDPLRAIEYQQTFEIVRAHFAADPTLPKDKLRYPLLTLLEPAKAEYRKWREGQPFTRQSELQVMHGPTGRVWIARVDLVQHKLLSLNQLPAGKQPAISGSEYREAGSLLRAYEPWRSALRQRGVDPAQVYIDLWAPGHFTLPPDAKPSLGADTRLMNALAFYRGDRPNPYDRPIEGLVATIDLNAMQVVHMSDTGARPISSDDGGPQRSVPAKPPQATQDRSELIQTGQRVGWHGFSFVLGFHPRDGLVLYDVRHGGRQIAHRMSLSEIYVPYGIGDPNWVWRSAFDVGEYNAGTVAQSLQRGADVPSHAQLIDVVVASDYGPGPANPSGTQVIREAIGLYEREAGILWTRSDPTSGERDTRSARELVLSWSAWIGNYIYNFDWVFKLDGSIEVRTMLNGTTLNRGTSEAPEPSAPKIGKDAHGVYTAAPHHQHFLNFRLDLDIDGPDNGVMEMEVARLEDPAFKNAFDTTMRHFEQEGARDVNPQAARHWHVESAHARNALGKPTSYALEPAAFALPYSAPDFPGLQRAGFVAHQLWFTRYREGELYAAGDFPYQAREPDGVPTYSTPAEPLDDVVLWYTTGFTHVSRPEDHPVMPSESISFRLIPRGFFDRNPAAQ